MSKTLFEEVLDDFFLRSIKKRTEPIEDKVTLGNFFHIGSSKNKNSFFQYFFELRGSIIVLKKTEKGPIIAYMDIRNTFIRLTQGSKIQDETYYGIKFFKKNVYEEIYTNDENVLQVWYQALKNCCILTKFRIYFKTVKKLGAGNFAQVFLVERISDKKHFAVKVFSKKEIMKDQLEIKCLRYEIEMMRKIKHNRVLGLIELYEGENNIYCLCEYYEGQNLLDAIIKKGAQPETKALSIILQLLISLEYLHSQHIIHRDIKPENIIFKSEKGVIDIGLVDLGFATLEKDYDKLFKRCGTPGYVAPEVLNDLPYDCKADIYSCGIIFYILLVKKSQWESSFLWNILQRNCLQKHERGN